MLYFLALLIWSLYEELGCESANLSSKADSVCRTDT